MPHAFAVPSATENADMKSVQQSDLGVIVPVYNRPTLLPDALESIVNQSRVPAEVVIVNDGSTDETGDVIEAWMAANRQVTDIKLLTTENRGVSAARNAGLRGLEKHEYVAFLDSDDIWPALFVERVLPRLQDSVDAVAATANAQKRDEGRGVVVSEPTELLAIDPFQYMFRYGAGIASDTIFRSSALHASGWFDPELASGEDAELFLRVALQGSWLHEPSCCVIHRYSDGLRNEPGHLSRLSDERLIGWNEIYERFLREHGRETPDFRGLCRLLSSRWRKAGFDYHRRGDAGVSRLCFGRAIHWNRLDLRGYWGWLRSRLS